MKRSLVGTLIVLHGLAHSNVVVWASSSIPFWLVNLLWLAALAGYLAAGLGILRVPLLRGFWKPVMVAATVASIVLLLFTGAMTAVLGIVMDLVLFLIVFEWAQPSIDADISVADAVGAEGLAHPRLHRLLCGVGMAALGYVLIVAATRPFTIRWGTTTADRASRLPGDGLVVAPLYRIDHGITIHAPANAVFPWIAQLGQGRGGFYSYDRLERFIGDDIRNAERIHPEWQANQPGDLIRAVQPDYLGGRFGDLGWKVLEVVPGRALVLGEWGVFAVEPVNDSTSRLLIRTRGAGRPSVLSLVAGPLNVFVFEPMHFVMERGMMRGVRDRAEASIRLRTASVEPRRERVEASRASMEYGGNSAR